MRPLFLCTCSVFFCVNSTVLYAQEWTRFRGPNGTGISDATTIPTVWTEKDYNWKIKIPGVGHSSPVLWGDRVFLTSGDTKTGDRLVICVETRVGEILWQKRFRGNKHRKHRNNSYATATPTVDAKRVYVTFGMPGKLLAIALDHDGEIVWQKQVDQFKGNHGHGVSPILHDGLLILANDQDKRGSLLALDAKTGAKNGRFRVTARTSRIQRHACIAQTAANRRSFSPIGNTASRRSIRKRARSTGSCRCLKSIKKNVPSHRR